jgi:hypothetical protein
MEDLIGKRIKLAKMEDDPNPIPEGSTGTVLNVVKQAFGIPHEYQVWVKWDNGRSLNLICPHDRFVVID